MTPQLLESIKLEQSKSLITLSEAYNNLREKKLIEKIKIVQKINDTK